MAAGGDEYGDGFPQWGESLSKASLLGDLEEKVLI